MDAGVGAVGLPARDERPVRLLLFAVGWAFAAVAAGFLIGAGLGLAIGLHNGPILHGPRWSVSPFVLFFASVLPLQLTLLLAARRRGRIVGHGDRAAGLGFGRLQRPRLLGMLAVVQVVCMVGWVPFVLRWVGHPPVTANARLLRGVGAHADTVALGVLLLTEVALAPVAEELFFRGWLWTALRRHWGVVPVALVTALPWLGMHALDGGLTRPLFLVPTAIVLSLARHYCGGTRASISLHVLNNLLVSIVVGASLLGGS